MSSSEQQQELRQQLPSSSSLSSSSSRPPSIDEAVRWILSKNFDADSRVCFLTLLKIIDNILQKPGNEKVRTLRVNNKTIRSKILDRQGHFVLLACGFVHEPADLKWRTEERLVLTEKNEDTQLLIRARHTLARIATLELRLTAEDLPRYVPPPKTQPPAAAAASGGGSGSGGGGFDVFRGSRFDGQSAAAGTNLGAPENWTSRTERDLSKLRQREAKLKSGTKRTAVDRQWTVFLPGSSRAPSSRPAISAPEAMANSTALKLSPGSSASTSASSRGDASLLASHFKQQHANRVAAENRGFTTKAMRDLEKLKKTRVYSHTQLAIHFPDGLSVRANFGTSETVRDVLEGLDRSVLFSTETLPLPPLELYQTPPRRVLGAGSPRTLKELGLVPAAKVYASWKRPLPEVGGGGGLGAGWYVRPELLSANNNNNGAGTGGEGGAGAGGPVLPTSVPVVRQVAASARAALGGGAAAAPKKKKPTKAEKEAALLKRMLGK